jgi:hypothetical protein
LAVGDLLFIRVPLQPLPCGQADVGQQTHRRAAMADLRLPSGWVFPTKLSEPTEIGVTRNERGPVSNGQ